MGLERSREILAKEEAALTDTAGGRDFFIPKDLRHRLLSLPGVVGLANDEASRRVVFLIKGSQYEKQLPDVVEGRLTRAKVVGEISAQGD